MSKKLKKQDLKILGKTTEYPQRPEDAVLETFPNPAPDRDYLISLDCPEFTTLCPITGQPDFATIEIHYVPNQKCVESKALKLYLFSFRNIGSFHEAVTNRILDDLVKAMEPRWIQVKGNFKARGGIAINVRVEKGQNPL
ncbi:NADPH-dependent 7-cyano-7-deazaguanine reductase QueF [bacterium (Candidatus Blackallbacteria) CG17_big_fil_post_rev_8_21_14_2_50_48_46]|uniref:NADPH-dependent 7-cyano-7-deazaguanine reductase n=1 Tax=bacterium (Candidatus Blackallbacteria) CG17_big_fil_post_rev_8_21_14_2_50_48_46 TaxID=2014261 RepID=A0A2M7GBL3_9BACT|nr:MAG: 7-cyano-7-deazaguanine reductase [bacterium (Candidatus Blackallbacteria) CG18_big_fil_WC_8_21_14_2_50_49_26]PIW19575.1 MAG: NADPH-dependent 7-cyano-7-deazaguanine reductase QueF [bacterium (Candidatus Blackallbacteria) CG17_big_fil_post_rev_8_21_14_2_50_48_46]PIW49103.1 MAG: NADPH-dependent 7-cyano-7-deazaguanine reductase QueF [bacterium (Candidatus Blackallbacteria) CG13_big_fil_rev_8_21_14_2_50_49_14]